MGFDRFNRKPLVARGFFFCQLLTSCAVTPASGAIAFLLTIFTAAPVAAGTSVAVGSEYMQWREYRPLPLLEETGFRPFVQVDTSTALSPRSDAHFAGRLYGGEVTYNGQLMDGTPLKATTGYTGVIGEGGATYRLQDSQDEGLSLVLRAGVDWWERDLKGSSGYREEYRLVYLRVGVQDEAPTGRWSARGGLLLPLSVREQVNLAGGFELEPKGKPSLYLDFGRHFGPSREAGVSFRRYRFDASDPESVDLDGDGRSERVLQPASELDVYSVYARFGF